MEATDRLRKYLEDIINAIDNIEITTNGLSPQSYQKLRLVGLWKGELRL